MVSGFLPSSIKDVDAHLDADYAESNAPPMLNYGWVYPQALLIFTITLCFSVVMPLILIFGALYFGVACELATIHFCRQAYADESDLVYKYKLLFGESLVYNVRPVLIAKPPSPCPTVYFKPYESNGEAWRNHLSSTPMGCDHLSSLHDRSLLNPKAPTGSFSL